MSAATPAPAPIDSDDSAARFALLEIDPPALPVWVTSILAAIAAIFPRVLGADAAFEALRALCAPLPTLPEWLTTDDDTRNTVRAAKDAKLAEIRAARTPLPATQRQAIPTVTTPEPITAPVQSAPSAPVATLQPVIGSWRKVNGDWCALMPTIQGTRAPRVGDVVCVERKSGQRTSNRVTALVRSTSDGVAVETQQTSDPVTYFVGTVPQAQPIVTTPVYTSPEHSAPVAALPEGAGITHTPTGPSIFDRPRSERTFKVSESKTRTDAQKLISERDFIAGAVAHGSMMQSSWTGSGQSTCEAFNAKLAPLGLADLAPTPPSAVRHAGDAVASLRGRDYDTTRLPSADLPDGVNARWLVGRKLSGKAIKAGDAFGTALLIVSLHDDETISFDGDADLAAHVRGAYMTSTAKETLRSNTLTPWLSSLLRNRFRAVKRGHVWYVPGGQADVARQLIETIAPLWGDHELMPVTTGRDLMRSLTRGLSDEVSALVHELATKTEDARIAADKRARKECAEHNAERTLRGRGPMHTDSAIEEIAALAVKRATVTAYVAGTIMNKLAIVAARTAGYEAALGEDSTVAVKAQIAALRAQLEPLADDAALRAAMLELA